MEKKTIKSIKPKKTYLDSQNLILILAIDRDDDIGIKISKHGSFIGRQNNLNVGVELAITDPSESDANCIFGAIKEYDKHIKQNENCQIITITGDRNVGIKSDKIILKQLDEFINSTKYKITECYVISDGAEDEQLLPLIRSRIEIVQSKRIVISQSVPLESFYYTILNFAKTVFEDKKLSRMFLGMPAIALLIFTIFGSAGFRLIIGLIGLFFLIKGFYLESAIESMYNEISTSLKTRKYSILLYICSLSLIIVGASTGYSAVQSALAPEIIVRIAVFAKASVLFFFLSAVGIGAGRLFSKSNYKTNFFSFLTFSCLCFSATYILYHISIFLIDNTKGYNQILIAVGISALLVGISIFFEKHFDKKKKKK